MTSDKKTPAGSASSKGDICSIYFQGQGPYLIPRKDLDKCPILASRLAAKTFFSNSLNTLDVKEISYDVGFTLMHYLMTGEYKLLDLDPEVESEEDRKCADLGTAFCVYAAAVMFGLIGLKNAAQGAMADLEKEMDLPMISYALKESGLKLEHYPSLAMHIYSHIQASKGVTSKEEMKSIINELGFPKCVNIDSLQSFLTTKVCPLKKAGDAKPKPSPKREQERPCSKDKKTATATIAQSRLGTSQTKKTESSTWTSYLPNMNIAKAFRRSQESSGDSTEGLSPTKSLEEVMAPVQGLSEESMDAAQKRLSSILSEDVEEGDLGLQEVDLQVPPPVKDL
ncbi:hypothetical protein FLONG3_7287 [Fusarium longipes]|uniref:Uncharacterized protein n=1 Tax=Fusarium longipes TaxID=694270 RepID=A0A395SEK1_9HYPO|nr:hypothetical protein FLONG3_7287 [Fusarium longipes]